jgi:hypothetical protein
VRVGHEIPQAWVQEAVRVVNAHAPSCENTSKDIRQAMGLGDGERYRALGGIAALDPGAP